MPGWTSAFSTRAPDQILRGDEYKQTRVYLIIVGPFFGGMGLNIEIGELFDFLPAYGLDDFNLRLKFVFYEYYYADLNII